MNEDKAREICEGIVKDGGCCCTGEVGRILGKYPCKACPFANALVGWDCGLRGALEGEDVRKRRVLAAKMFLDGEVVLVDGKLYEVSDGN